MDDAEIKAFWADARVRGGLNPAESYIGVTAADLLPPPAWSFGSTPEEADRLLALVLEGRKTASASARWEYEVGAQDDQHPDGRDGGGGPGRGDTLVRTRVDVELPAPGSLSIVLDGADHPRALIRTTHVEVVRFGDVDEDHARREGEGSLERWRAEHRRFFDEHAPAGQWVDEDTRVVLERFVVVVPAQARRSARRAGLL
ncbi:ASCH domain-containing protein [Ornithinimicrobium sp. W1665]|uniref:ASCH domain-containing protein n=1 Tax=Ornithinimicrobium sp. W1665 TaxID=3416666 RepID=UPI003CE79EEE